MAPLLAFSRFVDWINQNIGKVCDWLVLLAVLVSSVNAMMRYGFDISSNAWLELQWYMYAAIVMLGASYTLKRNEHVRVD
ncbi:MAG: TRAP transporter small permease subunit, partial [Alphaproteobacteria bacterium]